MPDKEYILCAAIHYDDGKEYPAQPKNIKTGYVWCGRRHHNIINLRFSITGKRTHDREGQGFITNLDRFVGREKAYEIAVAAGQVEKRKANPELDSHLDINPNHKEILISEDIY